MAITTGSGLGAGLTFEEQANFLFTRLQPLSCAALMSTIYQTTATELHIPYVDLLAAAHWIDEGAEIPLDDVPGGGILVTPRKVAAQSIASREAMDDSQPDLQAALGQALTRRLALAVDATFFGTAADQASSGFVGLGNVVGVTKLAGAVFTDLDAIAKAVGAITAAGGVASDIALSPADWTTLLQAKVGTGYNQPLMVAQQTPGGEPVFSAFGATIRLSSALPAGTSYVVDRTTVAFVWRQMAEIAVSLEAAFTSYSAIVQAVARVGYCVPDPRGVVQLTA